MSPDTTAHAEAFDGAKIALLCAGHVLSIQRDDRPDIPFPGYWDLPGGGREADETPRACVIRETAEELTLDISPLPFLWGRRYPGTVNPLPTWFFVAELPEALLPGIRLGNEGQGWRLIPRATFPTLDTAIPHLRNRLSDYLTTLPQP